jgi:DNA-binding NarL/FixJ family response regulator
VQLTRVLIVDDDRRSCRAWGQRLRRERFAVATASTMSEARAKLGKDVWDVVLLALALPDGYGAELLPEIIGLPNPPEIAIISGHLNSAHVVNLFPKCTVIVPKPLTNCVLVELVRCLEKKRSLENVVDRFCREHVLSPRESELMQASAQGLSDKEAALKLGCKRGSVRTFWDRIFRKTKRRSQRGVMTALLSFQLKSPR